MGVMEFLASGLGDTALQNDQTYLRGIQHLDAGDGRCFALQMVGTVGGTSPTLDGKIQESNDNSTWTDIPGATFTQVTASTSNQAITFDRTKRYVRYLGTIGGTSPSFAMAVVI